ncbi:Alpha/beta hydrolase domain-containing protein 17B [Blomia tropicalis]|nr:Alpha/beta hydrolase domain-containing protein 17B [Blomia tropicalis]
MEDEKVNAFKSIINDYRDRLVSKVAFCPPRDTYTFYFDNENDKKRGKNQSKTSGEILLANYMTTREDIIKGYRTKMKPILEYIECFYTFNKYGNRIACALFRNSLSSKSNKTIVYSHANAEDIGTLVMHLWRMRRALQMDIFVYDYSGFGMSSGSPSERNLYADCEAAVEQLCHRYSLQPKDLVLMGESIGTVPTVYMATKIETFGVILQSALLSGIRIHWPYDGPTLPYDPLPSIERIPLIKAKTLVIHGTDDQMIDITHAIKMFKLLPNTVTPYWAIGQSHMTVHKDVKYYCRLKYFIDCELYLHK